MPKSEAQSGATSPAACTCTGNAEHLEEDADAAGSSVSVPMAKHEFDEVARGKDPLAMPNELARSPLAMGPCHELALLYDQQGQNEKDKDETG